RPFVLGALWNGQDKPPVAIGKAVSRTGKVDQRVIKTRAGHIITLDDTDGAGSISSVDYTGSNKVTIDSQRNAISLEASGDISISAKGKVSIEAQAGIDIKSPAAAVTVKGLQIQLN